MLRAPARNDLASLYGVDQRSFATSGDITNHTPVSLECFSHWSRAVCEKMEAPEITASVTIRHCASVNTTVLNTDPPDRIIIFSNSMCFQCCF